MPQPLDVGLAPQPMARGAAEARQLVCGDGTVERAKTQQIRCDEHKDCLPEPARNETVMLPMEHDEKMLRRAA